MKPQDLEMVKGKLPLSKSTLARNPLLGAGSNPEATLRNGGKFTDSASIIGLSADGQRPEKFRLNKTEQRFLLRLQGVRVFQMAQGEQWGEIRPQAITLELGDRCRYRPDFSVVINGKLTFFEVKGAHIWDSGKIKYKVAPRVWPEFDFYLAQWKNGKWTETKLLP